MTDWLCPHRIQTWATGLSTAIPARMVQTGFSIGALRLVCGTLTHCSKPSMLPKLSSGYLVEGRRWRAGERGRGRVVRSGDMGCGPKEAGAGANGTFWVLGRTDLSAAAEKRGGQTLGRQGQLMCTLQTSEAFQVACHWLLCWQQFCLVLLSTLVGAMAQEYVNPPIPPNF